MSYTKTISKGIKNLRLMQELTQEQFAERVSMSINGLRNIEQGKYAPNAKTIDLICNAFKITPVELLLPIKDSNVEKLLINKIKALKPIQQEKLNKFLNADIL